MILSNIRLLLMSTLILFSSVSAMALEFTDECEKKYGLPQPVQRLGKHAMRSQQQLDTQECSSKVGPDFCINNQKSVYMQNCTNTLKKEQEKREEEAFVLMEKVKKSKKDEKNSSPK